MLFFAPHFIAVAKSKFAAKYKVGKFFNVEYKKANGTPYHSQGRLDAMSDDGELSFTFADDDGNWNLKDTMSCLAENITPTDGATENIMRLSYETYMEKQKKRSRR